MNKQRVPQFIVFNYFHKSESDKTSSDKQKFSKGHKHKIMEIVVKKGLCETLDRYVSINNA